MGWCAKEGVAAAAPCGSHMERHGAPHAVVAWRQALRARVWGSWARDYQRVPSGGALRTSLRGTRSAWIPPAPAYTGTQGRTR